MSSISNNFYSVPYKIHSLFELFDISTVKYSNNIVAEYYTDGVLNKITYKQFREDVLSFADYLLDKSLDNSYILLSGKFDYFWLVSYFAVILANSTVVCIDKSIIGTDSIYEAIDGIEISACIIDTNVPANYFPEIFTLSFDQIKTKIQEWHILQRNYNFKHNNFKRNIALVQFTSGTTGRMKPVYLSHENLAYDVMGCQMLMGRSSKDRLFSILPAHHAFEQTVGILTPIFVGATICISRGLGYFITDIKAYSPTIIPVVPMMAKTLLKNINLEIKRKGKDKLIDKLIKLEAMPLLSEFFRFIVYFSIKKYLGGRLKTIVCGGAPLDVDVQKRFIEYGFEFLNGYGITECSPVVSCSRINKTPLGSVGIPMPFCEVTTIDGEICVKGAIVANILDQPVITNLEYDGEWFKTGDLGYIDDAGNIFITGRKKDLIILDNGENVSPEAVERLIKNIEGLEDIIICSTKNHMNNFVITAVIIPNNDYFNKDDNFLIKYFTQAISNLRLPNRYRIERIIIWREPFPQTSSGKVKRYKIVQELGEKY